MPTCKTSTKLHKIVRHACSRALVCCYHVVPPRRSIGLMTYLEPREDDTTDIFILYTSFLSAKQTWRSWCCSCVCPFIVMLKIWVTEWPSDRVTEWPSDQVTKWLSDRMTGSDQVTKWSSDWVTKWLSDLVIEWPNFRVTGWQEASQTIDRMVYFKSGRGSLVSSGCPAAWH